VKFKINPFLRLFYLFVKSIVLVSFGIFYRKEFSHNEHYFKTPGPCIIIGNHPNTMVDVLNVAKKKKAIVHFLANAGLFSSKIGNWFFSTFYCIKVERPRDVKGRKINNKDSFKKSADFLSRYGTLYIAAEGGSKLERRLRKLKTGGVRIAFDTMQKNNWELPLCFLPVGITYENPKLARYDLFYNFGEPIFVNDYKVEYESNPNKTVKQLTNDLQLSMQNLLLHTEPGDDDVDKLVQKLENIHKNEFGNDHANQFFISKKWIEKLIDLKTNKNSEYLAILDKVNSYCHSISTNGISDKSICRNRNIFLSWLVMILGIVPAIWGWLNNILAFVLPGFILRKTGLYLGYTSTVKLLLAVFFLPFIYWLQTRLFGVFFQASFAPLIYIVSTIALGFFAMYYFRAWSELRSTGKWRSMQKQNKAQHDSIMRQRAEIIDTVFSQLSS